MSDVQWLFIVLAALYGWECSCWLRRGSVAFCNWFGRWFIAHPGGLVGNQSGGFILALPFPPLGTLLTANQFPLSLSPDGVLAWVSTNVNPGWRSVQSGRYARFDHLNGIQVVGRKVMLREIFFKSPTLGQARWIVANLKKIAGLKMEQRADAIASLMRSMFNEKAASQRWTDAFTHWRRVRRVSNTLLVYVFLVAPVAIQNLGFKLSWLGLLIGLLLLTATAAVLFWRSHRALFPEADDERFTHALTILLAPTTAMRAHDVLSRSLLETFHPLTAAKVFLPEQCFRDYARCVLLDMRHPVMPISPPNPEAEATEAYSRRVVLAAAEDFLTRNGLVPDELCRPPKPADELCRAYCSRCNTQFTTADATCTDCGGRPLVPFPAGK